MGTQQLQVVAPPTPLTSTGTLENAGVTLAGTFDNSTILAPIVDIGVEFVPLTTPVEGQYLAIYLVPWVNGTHQTSVDTSTASLPFGTLAGNVKVTVSPATIIYGCIPAVPLSAVKYDVYIQNVNCTWISSWTITFNPTNWQY